MFNTSSIQSAMSGLVGFSHSYHLFYERLASAFKSASSGYYVNSLPGVGFDVIEHTFRKDVEDVDLIVDEYYEIRANGGSADFTNIGAADNSVGTVFKATGTTPTAWGTGRLRLVSCNQYLTDLVNAEAIHLVNAFVGRCKDELYTKELLSNKSIIQGVADRDSKVSKNDRFVGFIINPAQSQNVKTTIRQLGVLFDGTQDLTIYLYDTSKKAAVKSHTFSIGTADTIEWETVTDWILQYDSTSGIGQQFLIGYFEDELIGQAYQQYFDDGSKNRHFRMFGKYLGVAPVAIPAEKLDGVNLPGGDVSDYISDELHGLYFKMSVKCDITNVLVDNVALFGQALQHAVGLRILEDAVNSGSDGVHNPVKDSMLQTWSRRASQIKGTLWGGYTTEGRFISGLMDRLTMDFSDLDPICLKKKKRFLEVGRIVK